MKRYAKKWKKLSFTLQIGFICPIYNIAFKRVTHKSGRWSSARLKSFLSVFIPSLAIHDSARLAAMIGEPINSRRGIDIRSRRGRCFRWWWADWHTKSRPWKLSAQKRAHATWEGLWKREKILMCAFVCASCCMLNHGCEAHAIDLS